MIRRKNRSLNQGRPTSKDLSTIRHQSKNSKNAKYNYQLEEVGKIHSKFEGQSFKMSERFKDEDKWKEIRIEEDAKNQQNWYQGRLKKGELYDSRQLDSKYGSLEVSRKAAKEIQNNKLFREEQNKEYQLKDTALNQLNLSYNIDPNSFKTIRKTDPYQHNRTTLSTNQVQLSDINHKSLKDHQMSHKKRQQTSQSQLNAKYDQIWKTNQLEKQKSFSNDNQNITLRNVQQQNFLIRNTRGNILKSRRILNGQEQRRQQSYCQNNSRFISQQQDKNRKQRQEVTRSPSAMARSRNQCQFIDYNLAIPFPREPVCLQPPSQLCSQLGSLRYQTDVRLRMIQDFSSKISVRILQLTTNLDEMCAKKK